MDDKPTEPEPPAGPVGGRLRALLNWPAAVSPPQVVLDRLVGGSFPPGVEVAVDGIRAWVDTAVLPGASKRKRAACLALWEDRLGLGTGDDNTRYRRLVAALLFSPYFAGELAALEGAPLGAEARAAWRVGLARLLPLARAACDPHTEGEFLPLWDPPPMPAPVTPVASSWEEVASPCLDPVPPPALNQRGPQQDLKLLDLVPPGPSAPLPARLPPPRPRGRSHTAYSRCRAGRGPCLPAATG